MRVVTVPNKRKPRERKTERVHRNEEKSHTVVGGEGECLERGRGGVVEADSLGYGPRDDEMQNGNVVTTPAAMALAVLYKASLASGVWGNGDASTKSTRGLFLPTHDKSTHTCGCASARRSHQPNRLGAVLFNTGGMVVRGVASVGVYNHHRSLGHQQKRWGSGESAMRGAQ